MKLQAFVRIGATQAIAYRTEALLWLLSTTMPLIMMAFFRAVTRDGPIGAYSSEKVVAYFLATFVVRSLTASWISWQVNLDVRSGVIGSRLLLPVHPAVSYAAESLGAMPVRAAGAVTVAAVTVLVVAPGTLTEDPVLWGFAALSVAFAWFLSLFVSLTVGALAFFVGSSAKVMDAWLAALFVFGGYLVPLDLFPPRVRGLVDWLPFRYQIGLPVELALGLHDRASAGLLVARQSAFVALGALATYVVWREGQKRFVAYGG